MTMNIKRREMIATLTEDLRPVRSFSLMRGLVMVAIALVLTEISVQAFGMLSGGNVGLGTSLFLFITNGLLLIMGFASAIAALSLASPYVGNCHEEAKWTSAMVAILPVAAILSLLKSASLPVGVTDYHALNCFLAAIGASLLVFAVLTFWLRRGAPVSLGSAGWLTGIASGALGSLAYGITCPIDTVAHIGIWHVAPVAVMAVVGRFAVPPLVRW